MTNFDYILRVLITLSSALLILCGCNSSNQSGGSNQALGGASASCDTRSTSGSLQGQCRDWSDPSGGMNFSVSCSGMGGTLSSAACVALNRVGSCVLNPVLGITATYRYYSATYTNITAQNHCTTLGGSFSP